MPGIHESSLSTYQNFDGSNTTLIMQSFGKKLNKVTLTGGLGASTNFKDTNAFVLEGKAKYAIDNHFSVQARLRNSLAFGNSSSQLRLSPGYKTAVSDKVSLYINPYVAAKYNYNSQTLKTDIGAFAGAEVKINNKLSAFLEFQKYNGFKGGSENYGGNGGISYNF